MKKLLSAILCIAMTATLVACGSQTSPDASGDTASETKIVLKVAAQGADNSHEIETLNNFAALASEYSNGTVEVQVFSNGSLGSLTDMIEGVTLGTIEMCFAGIGNLQQICPDFAAYDQWMYGDAEDIIAVYNSEIGQSLNQKLLDTAATRLLSYCNCTSGRMYLWSSTPLKTMDDYKNLTLRVPGNKSIATALAAIGKTAQVGFGDMYTAAQTGMIDVGSADIATMISAGYDEVVPYCNEITPNYMPLALVVSESVYQSMSEDQQQALTKAAVEACTYWGTHQDELKAEAMEMLEDSKSQLVEMEPAELEKMNDLIHNAIADYLSTSVDPNTIAQIREIVGK